MLNSVACKSSSEATFSTKRLRSTIVTCGMLRVKRLHLYYDVKLVTFGIDRDRNLIIQFPIFVQPCAQQPLILYQLETVPVPIVDKNSNAQSYTKLKIKKPYIALNSEMYINIHQHELATYK